MQTIVLMKASLQNDLVRLSGDECLAMSVMTHDVHAAFVPIYAGTHLLCVWLSSAAWLHLSLREADDLNCCMAC